MIIQSVVIHEINKNEKSTGADMFLTDNLLDSKNQKIIDIISSLDASFSKKTIRRAKFSNDGFRSTITNFSKIDLVNTSKSLTEKLRVYAISCG